MQFLKHSINVYLIHSLRIKSRMNNKSTPLEMPRFSKRIKQINMHTDFIKNLKSHSVELHTPEDTAQKDRLYLYEDSELNRFPILDSFLSRPSVVQDYNPSLQEAETGLHILV